MKRARRIDLPPFTVKVLMVVQQIPRGRVATYGDVAALAGRPRAARAVGAIMKAAPRPGLPYHRVVAAGGRLGGFGGNPDAKRALLRMEDVLVAGTRIRRFASIRWTRPARPGPARRQPAPDRRRGGSPSVR